MKKSVAITLTASLMLATPFVSAEETLPLKAVNRAGEVIDAALVAYGGAEAISNLNSVARRAISLPGLPTKVARQVPPGMKGSK